MRKYNFNKSCNKKNVINFSPLKNHCVRKCPFISEDLVPEAKGNFIYWLVSF